MSELINQKMMKIMEEIGHIGRDAQNADDGYSYRSIDAILSRVQKVLLSNGVYFTPTVLESTMEKHPAMGCPWVHVKVQYTFHCVEDGSSVSVVTVGEGMDFNDKASNKAMTAALKYALGQTFCIPFGEDGDAESPVSKMFGAEEILSSKAEETVPEDPVVLSSPTVPEAPKKESTEYPGDDVFFSTFKAPNGFIPFVNEIDIANMADKNKTLYRDKSNSELVKMSDKILSTIMSEPEGEKKEGLKRRYNATIQLLLERQKVWMATKKNK